MTTTTVHFICRKNHTKTHSIAAYKYLIHSNRIEKIRNGSFNFEQLYIVCREEANEVVIIKYHAYRRKTR